jgi:phosphoglycerate dehydrogenase-like enzyme
LLALLREIPAADRLVRQGRWSQGAYPLTSGLARKSVGIVGLWRIGRGIAARLLAFGVDPSYCGSVKADVPFRHLPSAIELAQA